MHPLRSATRDSVRSWLAAALCGAAALVGGCDRKDCAATSLDGGAYFCTVFSGFSGPSVYHAYPNCFSDAKAKPAAPLDRCIGIGSRVDGAGGAIRPRRLLSKPFRAEATLALRDPARAAIGDAGRFGISVAEDGGFGAGYFLRVKRDGAGIAIEAGTGATVIRTLTIPDSLEADVALESVGGLIVLSGRKRGDASFTQIAAAVAPSAGPYQVSFDANNLAKGSVVAFDTYRVTANAAPPGATPGLTAREAVYKGVDALAEAMYAMDGAAIDRNLSGGAIDLAVSRFDAVLAAPPQGAAKALKKVKAARKKAAALAPGVRGSKSANAAIATLLRAMGTASAGAEKMH